jgi:hypothetical protein
LNLRGKWQEAEEDCVMRILYASPNIMRVIKFRMREAGHVAHIGEMRDVFRILVGRPRRRWEVNVRMHLREIRWKGVAAGFI